MFKINKLLRLKTGFLAILTIFIVLAMFIIIAIPVSACYYTVGTFESDYSTSKDSFLKGQTVYGRGNAYNYNYFLKLRIIDPNGNIIFTSNKSQHVVYCSYNLNESALTGVWSIQLGILKNNWQWSTLPGRISYFTVNEVNFSLFTNVIGNGSIIKDVEQDYFSYGSIVNVSAIAGLGWCFDHWSGDLNGNNISNLILMDSDKTITANFVQNFYHLEINVSGNGSVNIDPDKTNYSYGSIVNLTAFADEEWYFYGWTGDITGYENPFFVSIDNDKNITAIFKKSIINTFFYNITIYVEGNGIVNINPNKDNYSYGEIVEITAIPDSNWYLDCWTGDITGNNLSNEINMTSNKIITAQFKEIENQGEDSNSLEKVVGGGGGTNFNPSTVEKSNIPPVAIAGGPYYGLVEENITFNGSKSYDTDHYIKSFTWDFGDGSIIDGEIVTHAYSTAGKYKVILNVTDTKGKISSNSTYAIISEPNHSPSKPNISGPTLGFTDIEYVFYIVSHDEDNDSINYMVNWGDETQNISDYMPSSQILKISHKWSSPSIYIINVTAEDDENISTNELIIKINEPADQDIFETYNIILVIFLIIILLLSLFLLKIQEKNKF